MEPVDRIRVLIGPRVFCLEFKSEMLADHVIWGAVPQLRCELKPHSGATPEGHFNFGVQNLAKAKKGVGLCL